MDVWVLLIVVLAVQAAMLVALLVLLRRKGESAGVLNRVEALDEHVAQRLASGNSDLAERLERVRGDLRQDLTDRITSGLLQVKASVEQQLHAGRLEQDNRLRDTVTRLEAKFDDLNTRQARGLTDARQELTQSLANATRTLEERFVALDARTNTQLEAIRGKVDERLGQIATQVQQKLDQNIKEGFAQFEKVQQHLRAAEEQLRNVGMLGSSINDLNTLLKLPHLRGRFGEAGLERLLADFLPASLYELQTSATGEDRGRPDAIIKFPDRKLPIDSKFPREQVLPLFESNDPAELAAAREALARVMKEQGKKVAGYIEPEAGTTNCALLYLPAETLWFEVIQNRELYDYLAGLRVFPVSPNTLLPVLHAISLTHKWYQVAAGFQNTARELSLAQKHFANFYRRFEEVGRSLTKAQEAYSTATTHLGKYQSRIVSLTGEAAEVEIEMLGAPPPGEATLANPSEPIVPGS
ncbi:MAG: DNA recombination protein RmuC [Phycisphaerae bacterium]